MKLETTNTIERDVIILTTKTVEFLISTNPDSLTLYIFFIKNSKIQETNKIWNTDTFGMTGLGWGRDRYIKAKDVLVSNKLIEITDNKDINGKFIKTYIKINYLFKEKTTNEILNNIEKPFVQNPQAVSPTSGETPTNALSNKSNALSNKKEILSTNVDKPLTKKEIRRLQVIKNKEARLLKKKEREDNYSFKGEMNKLINSNWKPDKIIYLYFLRKRFNFENLYQFEAEYKRNINPAKALEGYSSSQVDATINMLESSGLTWSLNAVTRNISNVVNRK